MDRESLLREAELARYRALEAERVKWEARESRVVEQLEAARRVTNELGENKEVIIQLEMEREAALGEAEELRARLCQRDGSATLEDGSHSYQLPTAVPSGQAGAGDVDPGNNSAILQSMGQPRGPCQKKGWNHEVLCGL